MRDADLQQMLRTIEQECAFTAPMTGRKQISPAVMRAMAAVPREEFVPPEVRRCAYADIALPIGQGQTISQPFVVALMTDLLAPEPEQTVLEVGTGSGYQAAVLSRLVRKVVSLEIVPKLAQEAAARLHRLDFDNVEVHTADGYFGWPEHAPFGGIIITAATAQVPPPLLEQLRAPGKMVVPLGPPGLGQELTVFEKDARGDITRREVLGVAFVPLTGTHR